MRTCICGHTSDLHTSISDVSGDIGNCACKVTDCLCEAFKDAALFEKLEGLREATYTSYLIEQFEKWARTEGEFPFSDEQTKGRLWKAWIGGAFQIIPHVQYLLEAPIELKYHDQERCECENCTQIRHIREAITPWIFFIKEDSVDQDGKK